MVMQERRWLLLLLLLLFQKWILPRIATHLDFAYAIKVENLELNLGEERGVSERSVISTEVLQKILKGVESGNKDNIYFYGLMKLYGISMSKDLSGAAQQFQRASALGHKEATTAYGVMMLTGILGKIDYSEALRYFREGVAREDMNAHWLLGKMLMEGKGIPAPLYVEAALHLQKASDAGVPQAHHCLAVMYEYGKGIAQDFKKAVELYERAIEENQLESMYHLGLMYAYGRGTAQDFLSARAYFEKAANFDHAPSIYYIGVFKTYGYGCAVNYDQSIRWFQRAASIGDDRVYQQALAAAKELQGRLEEAHEINEKTIRSFHQRNEM